MPRYCAVKACRNRGGSASRQDNKRISFYPFPLHDKPRLQKWVDNMKRGSGPQVGISACADGEKKGTTIKKSPKAKPWTLGIDTEPTRSDSPLNKRPLILSKTCKRLQSNTTNTSAVEHTDVVVELPVLSDTSFSCYTNQSEIQTPAREVPGDSGMPKASCLALSPCSEPHSEELADSTVTVLCCESLGPFSNGEANVDVAALQAALGQAFSFVPVEIIKDQPLGEGGPGEGEHISVYEHSYCRPDTDKDQLWSKILSLHTKILELDRREESAVAKIHALETEIALLKRDGAVFKEKQKVLEDYISSMLL
ncbi:hypothetical protein INR49_026608 [Caranx melampygus]|nr:hypothetical protein INR49_026608 [Caranx melampygus]